MIFWDVTPCILVDRQHHCRTIEYLHSVIRASGGFILSRSVVSVYLSLRSVVNFDLLLSFNPWHFTRDSTEFLNVYFVLIFRSAVWAPLRATLCQYISHREAKHCVSFSYYSVRNDNREDTILSHSIIIMHSQSYKHIFLTPLFLPSVHMVLPVHVWFSQYKHYRDLTWWVVFQWTISTYAITVWSSYFENLCFKSNGL